jgi:hypothetical protein
MIRAVKYPKGIIPFRVKKSPIDRRFKIKAMKGKTSSPANHQTNTMRVGPKE